MRTFKAVLAGLLVVVLGACADDSQDLLQPPSDKSLAATQNPEDIVPDRSEDGTDWFDMTDGELWNHVAERDSTVVVGLKQPGAKRGIWKDRVLISAAQRADGRQAVAALRGVAVIDADTLLPVLVLKLSGERSLTQLRQLPFTDYVEPGLLDIDPASGCGWNPVSGTSGYPRTFAGDLLTPNYRNPNVQMESAWNRATGDGVTIGFPDSGVTGRQPHMNRDFASGHSAGRWYHHDFEKGTTPHGPCSHGTRVAGVATAPMNGHNAVGVAWRANAVNIRIFDEAPYHCCPPSRFWRGIRTAASFDPDGVPWWQQKRRIVNMSWNTGASNSIGDEIRLWHGRNRLFIGAAGQRLGNLHPHSVGWPARMSEVVAVSAVNANLSRRTGYHYGSAIELSFYHQSGGHRQKSPGETSHQVSDLRGTSATAAVVSGMAALVWSRYPNASRDWVRERLVRSAHYHPQRTNTFGHGIVNAYRAVGGFWRLSVSHPSMVEPFQTFTTTANPAGDGPFRYRWSNGATSRSTSYRAGGDGTQTHFWVDVTDTYENRTRRYNGTVHARDTSGCADPTQIEC